MTKPINRISLSVSLNTTAIILTITITLGCFSFLQYIKHITETEHSRLNIIAPLFMNAVAGNIILEDDRSINAIKKDFKHKYRLKELTISPHQMICPEVSFPIPTEFCWSGQIPDIKVPYFLMIKSMNNSSILYLKTFICWTILPLSFLGLLIPIFIQRKLRNSIVNPIVALSKDPENWNNITDETAKEVIILQKKLKEFIAERDSQLINTERIKAAEALEKLTAQIAHDVRSPLAVMEISVGKIANEPSSKHIELVQEAIQNVRVQMQNLLIQYRNKPISDHANKINPLKLVNLPKMLELIIDQKREEWKREDVINISVEPLCNDKYIWADPNYLNRCISNLLNNAYESINGFGSIKVICCYVNQHIQLSITDSGCGICKSQIDAVINGYSTKHEGKGLGLCSANEYIKSLRGALSVNSQLGKGTTVTLLIPTE